MQRIDILLTSEHEGGDAPFIHGELEIVFHQWSQLDQLPLLEGELWAFVDWVLPNMSGLEACRRLRAEPLAAQAHITLILDDDDIEDRKRALRSGADDYMVGPIDRTALLDRVLSHGTRSLAASQEKLLASGDLAIDVAAFQARWQGKPIELMPNEFRLLRYFAEHPGRVFSRVQLISALGKQEPEIDERTVDVWIGRLRRALKKAGAESRIRTVRSLGYVFDAN